MLLLSGSTGPLVSRAHTLYLICPRLALHNVNIILHYPGIQQLSYKTSCSALQPKARITSRWISSHCGDRGVKKKKKRSDAQEFGEVSKHSDRHSCGVVLPFPKKSRDIWAMSSYVNGRIAKAITETEKSAWRGLGKSGLATSLTETSYLLHECTLRDL